MPRPKRGTADLRDVTGLSPAKRALEIAAAGGHSLLLVGPPGCGAAALADCLHGLLPGDYPDETAAIAADACEADMQIDVGPFVVGSSSSKEEESTSVARRVRLAREVQLGRQGCLNQSLRGKLLEQVAGLDGETHALLANAEAYMALSSRSLITYARVARSIADLDDAKAITRSHMAEALIYLVRSEPCPTCGTYLRGTLQEHQARMGGHRLLLRKQSALD